VSVEARRRKAAVPIDIAATQDEAAKLLADEDSVWGNWCDYVRLINAPPDTPGGGGPAGATWADDLARLELAIATSAAGSISDIKAKMMLLREWRERDDVRYDHLDERLIAGVIMDLQQVARLSTILR
jgi:hypothetical protein